MVFQQVSSVVLVSEVDCASIWDLLPGLVILDLGQQVIARGDRALERFFLSVFGVEREHTTLQAEGLDQLRRGRNLVALLRDHQMAEHDLIGLPQPTSRAPPCDR